MKQNWHKPETNGYFNNYIIYVFIRYALLVSLVMGRTSIVKVLTIMIDDLMEIIKFIIVYRIVLPLFSNDINKKDE